MIELFTGDDDNYFARGTRNLGIHNLRSHFIQLEKRLLSGLPPNGEPLALSLESEALVAAEKNPTYRSPL
jgi:hypothetical protein